MERRYKRTKTSWDLDTTGPRHQRAEVVEYWQSVTQTQGNTDKMKNRHDKTDMSDFRCGGTQRQWNTKDR